MSQHDDGGPAFPAPKCRVLIPEGGSTQDATVIPLGHTGGMTLRDWFAGQALAGLATNPDWSAQLNALGDEAYTYADAMLAERAKQQEAADAPVSEVTA